MVTFVLQINILVNNAGRSQRAIWEEVELEVDREIFELNVFSVVSLSRIAVNYFNKCESGHIVVMSSLAGVIGAPYSASYTATKHAIQVSTVGFILVKGHQTVTPKVYFYFEQFLASFLFRSHVLVSYVVNLSIIYL